MAVYNFSALADGQEIAFDPNADVLNFDQTSISASDVMLTRIGANTETRLDVPGKHIFFAAHPTLLATSNVTFANGSLLLLGDNSTSNANDDAANVLTGGAGNDHLEGFGGADTMNGGAGNDTYVVGSGDVLSDSGGTDTIVTDINWTMGSAFENLRMTGTGNIFADGNALANVITGNAGNNNIQAGDGNDTASGGAGNDTVGGNGGTDWVEGGAGNDTVAGGGGQDSFAFHEFGAANADLLTDFSGPGWDNLQFDAAAFTAIGASGRFASGDVRFFAGAGATSGHDADDRIVYNTSTGQLFYDADGNGSGAAQLVATLNGLPGLSATDINVFGTAPAGGGGNVIDGTEGDDSLVGTAADETLNGFGGNDTLDGQGGNNVLNGGLGDDTYLFHRFNDTINDAGGTDTEIVSNETAAVLAAGIENLTVREINQAFSNTDVFANELDNVVRTETTGTMSYFVRGLAGNDTLLGGSGFEDFVFGVGDYGNDTVDGGSNVDGIDFTPAETAVRLDFRLGFANGGGTGGSGTVTFTNVEVGAGGQFNDQLIANDAGSRLLGRGGSDVITGGSGNDTLEGEGFWGDAPTPVAQAGNDFLSGGAGDDQIDGGGGSDTLVGGLGNDTLNPVGEGTNAADRLVFDVAPGAANADVVNLFHTGQAKIVLDGNAYTNIGASGDFSATDARFFAGAGAASGHDTDDRVIYDTSSGNLWYDADGSAAGAAQLIATLAGAPAMAASDVSITNGGATDTVINGTEGDDSLVGGPGDDTINGFGGNDTLDGQGGNDQLNGGLGNDTYLESAGSGADVISDAGGADTVIATGISWSLGSDTENLTMRGASSNPSGPTANGNALDNVIRNESTNNTVWFDGGDGNDTLIGGNQGDIFVFANGTGNYGNDVVDGGGNGTGPDWLFTGWNSAVVVNMGTGMVTGGGTGGSGSISFTNIEAVIGGSFNDRLTAGDVGVKLEGGNGNDTLIGGTGNDTLEGGDSFDHPPSDNGDDLISGGAGNDTLTGDQGSDTLSGGLGNDLLSGDSGSGDGSDSFLFDVSPGTANADRVDDFVSSVDKIHLDATVMNALGASGNFTAGDARFFSGAGANGGHDADDRVVYNTSTGQLWYDADGNGAGSAQLIATLANFSGTPAPLAATDIAVDNGTAGGQVINGTAGNDALFGGPGDDTINAGAGNDFVEGENGNDSIVGGDGNDTLAGGFDNPHSASGAFNDTLDGGLGNDLYEVRNATTIIDAGGVDSVQTTVDYTLAAGIENLSVSGDLLHLVVHGNELDNVIEVMNHSGGDDHHDSFDTVFGGAGNDTFTGFGGGIFDGEAGDDVLLAGGFSRTLTGGSGADSFVLGSLTAQGNLSNVVTDFASGADKMHLDALVMPALGASGNFAPGDARFFAAAGATGGHDADDRVIYNTTTGELLYDADGNGIQAAQLIATLQNHAAIVATDLVVDNGTAPGGVINGTAGDDSLTGTNGNDTINGLAGNDTLNGLGGADSLVGGDGNDTFFSIDSTPDDVLGTDTLDGGLGDDVYHVGGDNSTTLDVIADAGGIDTVHAWDIDWILGAGLENLVLEDTHGTAGVGIGNELDNVLDGSHMEGTGLSGLGGNDLLIGSSFNTDQLDGGDGNDTLRAGDGNDTLDGGAGIDSLDGGIGDDTFIVTAGDILVDAGGTDSVISDGNWTLAIGFENLTLAGTGNWEGQGNNADNRIDGNSGNNYINARAGNDTIAAGAGNDTIDMSTGGTSSPGQDSIDGGAGFDTIDYDGYARSGVTLNLSTGVATGGGDAGAGGATLSGIERVNGGAFNDSFTGGVASETLDGRGGNDSLGGGAGNDTLLGRAGNDMFVFREFGAANADQVGDFVSGTDRIGLDNAVMTALGTDGNFAAGDGRFFAAAGAAGGHDADDRLVFNTSTGQLYYDADGNGAGAGQLVATLQTGATLAATDITVI